MAGVSLLLLPLWPAGLVLVSPVGATVSLVVSETAVLVAWEGVLPLLLPGVAELPVSAGELLLGWPSVLVDVSFTSEVVAVVLAGVEVVAALLVLVLGGCVLEAVLQSKEMVGTWMLQLGLGLLGWGG